MKVHYERISHSMFFVIVLVEIIFLGFLWSSKHQDISFKNESLTLLDKEWTTIASDGNQIPLELPASLECIDRSISISRKLPKMISDNWVITTLSFSKSMNVYIDNALVYSSNEASNLPFELAPGSIWNIISLPHDAAGKTLTLEITPLPFHSKETINEVYIGSKAAFLLQVVELNGLNLFISIVIFLIALTLIVVYLSLIKFQQNNKSILYLGLFSLFISLWMMMESDIMQFFLDNRYFISSLKYLSLMTMPIPILFYISLIENFRYKKSVIYLNGFFIVNVSIMFILQLAGIMNFHDGLTVLHALMVIIFSILFVQLCIELFAKKNSSLRYFTLSFGILFIFSMIEIITYNLNFGIKTGSFLQFGVLFFLLVLSFNSLKKADEIVRLSENAKQYEYLATRDYMTKCKNRNAYIKELDHMTPDQKTAIILADINNTKYINDTYGHHAGDFIIVQCSQCLLDILGDDDYCYRIGGDEFVCIEYNKSEEMIQEKIKAFFQLCETVNADCPYPFEVSVGYAFFDKSQDNNIYDTVKRADKDMYHRKSGMKFKTLS